MALNPAGLPDDPLLGRRQFVCWAWTWSAEKGKWDKPPRSAHGDYPASVTASKDWATLGEALSAVTRYGSDGIGVVLTGREGVTGIDLDKCRDRDTGTIDDWAQAIIARLSSYWEPSASGTGIRIFVRAALPPGRRRSGQIEMYDSGRYLTINGNPGAGASRHFEARQAELDAWHAELFPAPVPTPPPVHARHAGRAVPPAAVDDALALERCYSAANGTKFRRLYDAGDWEAEGYRSHSEARAGLCSLIGFFVNRDPDRIEALFMDSALYDEGKWARERHNVLDLASVGEAFDWVAVTRWPLSALSTLATPPCPDTDDDITGLLAMSHEALARLAYDRGQLADERGRTLDAIDELMTAPNMTPVERIVAYGVVKAGASAQEQQTEDAPTRELVVNQKAIACDINVSRQTVGKALKQWDGQGYMGKEARPTGQRAKSGEEILETVIQLPARGFTDNLIIAATWRRPEGAKHVGGNGNRCPECGSSQRKSTERHVTVRTTIDACKDCGHFLDKRIKEIGKAKTVCRDYDAEPDVSTMLDITKMRGTPGHGGRPPIPPDRQKWPRLPLSQQRHLTPPVDEVSIRRHPPSTRPPQPPSGTGTIGEVAAEVAS
jgi:hypothetical protein